MLARAAGRVGSKCLKKQGCGNILIVGYRKPSFGAGSQSGTKVRCNRLRNEFGRGLSSGLKGSEPLACPASGPPPRVWTFVQPGTGRRDTPGTYPPSASSSKRAPSSWKNGECQPIFVTRKRRVFNQSGHENRWLYPIFRAHCTSAMSC